MYASVLCTVYVYKRKNYYADILTSSRIFKNLSFSLIKLKKSGNALMLSYLGEE